MLMRIVVCATHPWNTNGYSLVMSHLVERLAGYDDVECIHYFGFQNVHKEKTRNKRELPAKVEVFDAMEQEQPRKQGFGEDHIVNYVLEKDPHVVVIFNDSVVVERLTLKLSEIPARRFMVAVYQDLVYEHIKRRFVDQLNTHVDRVLAFTPLWKAHMEDQGVTTPVDVLRHGFDQTTKYPIEQSLARRYFGLNPDDFIILNLNRNQPRKRWDLCLKAFAELVSRHRGEPIKLLVGTAMQGGWDLLAIFERELKKCGMTLDEGRKHLVVIDAPQNLSDHDVNVLMNCADIGLSAADGEGFGLCNFEHAAIGRPQVVPAIGGMKDFFESDRAILCDPILAYYVDSSRDGVGGEAQIVDYKDLTEGMDAYYSDPELRRLHGSRARKYILENYRWDDQVTTLYSVLREMTNVVATRRGDCVIPDEIDFIPDVGAVAVAHDSDALPSTSIVNQDSGDATVSSPERKDVCENTTDHNKTSQASTKDAESQTTTPEENINLEDMRRELTRLSA